MTSKRFIAVSVAVLLLLAGCGKSDKKSSSTTTSTTAKSSQTTGSNASAPSAASVDKVDIKNFAFGPKAVKAKVGATITWTNQDDNKHTVTSDSSDPEKFDSGDLGEGKDLRPYVQNRRYVQVLLQHSQLHDRHDRGLVISTYRRPAIHPTIPPV